MTTQPSKTGQKIRERLERVTWAQWFLLASLIILAAGMAAIGAWIAAEIDAGVTKRTAETAAVYVDSAVAPFLQGLATQADLPTPDKGKLDDLFRTTPLGEQIPSFKVWTPGGKVVYATSANIVGQTFPIEGGLAKALEGQVAAEISALDAQENVSERARGKPLLEIYSPVRRTGSTEIIAVAEFYQSVEELQRDIAAAIQQTWLLVGVVTLGMYLLLAGFVRFASNTIARQQTELSSQVRQLQEVLHRNAELDERVRRAAAQSTALNERVLRRISAELHDGPAQDLGLASLKLDNVMERSEARAEHDCQDEADLNAVKQSLDHALQEIRGISSGMGVPQLSNLTPEEIVARVVRTHERRTGTRVALETENLPARVSVPLQITLYRVIQEALNNAYRHAQGEGQHVRVTANGIELTMEISDAGPGSNGASPQNDTEHLGVVGMRDRVESLGGTFEWQSDKNGTHVTARLPLNVEQANGYLFKNGKADQENSDYSPRLNGHSGEKA